MLDVGFSKENERVIAKFNNPKDGKEISLMIPEHWYFNAEMINELWEKQNVKTFNFDPTSFVINSATAVLMWSSYKTISGEETMEYFINIPSQEEVFNLKTCDKSDVLPNKIDISNIQYDKAGKGKIRLSQSWVDNVNTIIENHLHEQNITWKKGDFAITINPDVIDKGIDLYYENDKVDDENYLMNIPFDMDYFSAKFGMFTYERAVIFNKDTGDIIELRHNAHTRIASNKVINPEKVARKQAKQQKIQEWETLSDVWFEEEIHNWARAIKSGSVKNMTNYDLIKRDPSKSSYETIAGSTKSIEDAELALQVLIPKFENDNIRKELKVDDKRANYNEKFAEICGPYILDFMDRGYDIRLKIIEEYNNNDLDYVTRDYEFDTSFDMGHYNILKKIISVSKGEKQIVHNICMMAFPDKLNSLEDNLRQLLVMYKELFNITEHNIETVATFVVTHNLSDFYDDILVYDEGKKIILNKSKNKHWIKDCAEKVNPEDLKDSTYYFEKRVYPKSYETGKVEDVKINPLNVVEKLKELKEEFNQSASDAILINIVINEDESYTYQFYTFSRDGSDNDINGKRFSELTRLYNRRNPSDKLYFGYE